MASTTKILTALLALETCSLDDIIEIDERAAGTEGSSMYLKEGERLSLEDLLYGLMLSSGNDAAVAIATHISGDVKSFAALMNQRAQELGCTNSNFVTPNGLHNDDHYSSALDMARIAACAMKNEKFRSLVSTNYHKTDTGAQQRTLKNKNRILWEYEGGNGVKTGYTKKAGKCLVFSAERDGMQLIGVVLACPDMWAEAKKLLDYGFSNYEMTRIVSAEDDISYVAVENSEKKQLAAAPEHSILYPTRKNGEDEIEVVRTVAELTEAPVKAGTGLGSITVSVNGEILCSQALIAIEDADKFNFWFYLGELIRGWLAA